MATCRRKNTGTEVCCLVLLLDLKYFFYVSAKSAGIRTLFYFMVSTRWMVSQLELAIRLILLRLLLNRILSYCDFLRDLFVNFRIHT